MTKYHRAAMLPRAYGVAVSTLSDTRFLIVLYCSRPGPAVAVTSHSVPSSTFKFAAFGGLWAEKKSDN